MHHAGLVGSTSLVQKYDALAHQRIQDTYQKFSETISNYDGAAHEIRSDALAELTPGWHNDRVCPPLGRYLALATAVLSTLVLTKVVKNPENDTETARFNPYG